MATFHFTMGLPGAGKSHVLAERLPGVPVIDPDAIKTGHPDYDPQDPAALHVWSKTVANRLFAEALAAGTDCVLDGTGTNVEVLVANIRAAAEAGFETHLMFVTVSLETALRRNATRARTVPEQVIREKARTIYTAFELAAKEVSRVDVIWND